MKARLTGSADARFAQSKPAVADIQVQAFRG
jgi:hypothetical protein